MRSTEALETFREPQLSGAYSFFLLLLYRDEGGKQKKDISEKLAKLLFWGAPHLLKYFAAKCYTSRDDCRRSQRIQQIKDLKHNQKSLFIQKTSKLR